MKRSHLVLLALAAASAGCSTGFDPQYRVTDLRILAVRASVLQPPPAQGEEFHADVAPGDTVRLEALVADPRGRPVKVSYYGCAPSGPDAFTPCIDQEMLKDPRALASAPGVTLLGQVAFDAPSPDDPKAVEATLDVRIPSVPGAFDALFARALAQPTYQCSLFAEIPIVVVAEADGLSEIALKRVRAVPSPADFAAYATAHPASAQQVLALQDTYTVNGNPEIVEIARANGGVNGTCDGADSRTALEEGRLDASFPMGRTLLCGIPNQGHAFNVCDANGVSSQEGESRSWQWFVDAGEFPEFTGIGNAVDSSPEFDRPASPFRLWVVLRDGRGGVDWARRDVGAPPR